MAAAKTKVERFPRPLKLGMEGDDVKDLQLYLIAHDIGSATRQLATRGLTKKFGKRTLAAVIEFQKKHGIKPAEGVFGPATRTKMLSLIPSPRSDIYLFMSDEDTVEVLLIALSTIDWFASFKRKLKTCLVEADNKAAMHPDDAEKLIAAAEAVGYNVKIKGLRHTEV